MRLEPSTAVDAQARIGQRTDLEWDKHLRTPVPPEGVLEPA